MMKRNDLNNRIKYIDLAKGLCMLLFVIGHTGVDILIPGWSCATVPLFFVLSGYFFKEYSSRKAFYVRKINTLIIPFLFFYIISYFFFYIIKWTYPNLLITESKGITDVFTNRQFFNGPLWFLLALFWCNLIFHVINTTIKKDIAILILVILLGFMGWWIGNKKVFLPLFFDVSMTSFPFFAMGYFIKKYNILDVAKSQKHTLLLCFLLWIISIIIERTMHQRISLHYNIVEGWSSYILVFVSVMSLLYFCKTINSIPIINYIGNYSLIILCVHHMIYRPLKVFFINYSYLNYKGYTVALITIVFSIACIPVCSKLLPWFVGQKELIKIK